MAGPRHWGSPHEIHLDEGGAERERCRLALGVPSERMFVTLIDIRRVSVRAPGHNSEAVAPAVRVIEVVIGHLSVGIPFERVAPVVKNRSSDPADGGTQAGKLVITLQVPELPPPQNDGSAVHGRRDLQALRHPQDLLPVRFVGLGAARAMERYQAARVIEDLEGRAVYEGRQRNIRPRKAQWGPCRRRLEHARGERQAAKTQKEMASGDVAQRAAATSQSAIPQGPRVLHRSPPSVVALKPMTRTRARHHHRGHRAYPSEIAQG